MPITICDQRNFYESLTRYNYFPNQKSAIGELPPCLDTRQFTPEVCEALAKLDENRDRKKSGYDLVEYKATRYNNVPRILGLPHPKAHALLVKHIYDNWEVINHIQDNDHSIVKPQQHQDGRIMVMNYEEPISKKTRYQSASFSKRFRVHADVANCFNSIYTHAIPWAAIGFSEAKGNRDSKAWFNKLDMFQRKSKRNETQGVPIGPATSNVSVELILGKIDQELASKGFHFHRYVDDYTCFCETSDEANQFVLLLNQELSKYKLTLNLSKTKTVQLPYPSEDDWVLELHSSTPNRYEKNEGGLSKYSASEVLTFLNKAILINKRTPDGSVLKYAVQLIVHNIDDDSVPAVIYALLELTWHYPLLIPFLEPLFDQGEFDLRHFENQIEAIILENVRLKRSDGIAWPLHILKKGNVLPSEKVISAVLGSEDCVSIAILLSMMPKHVDVDGFISSLLKADSYTKDTYWLLLYQAYLYGKIVNPYDDAVFEVLKKHEVNFIPGASTSYSEKKCDEIATLLIADIFKDAAAQT